MVARTPAQAMDGAGMRRKTTLDAADIRILSAVQEHGPLSKTQLAEIVNLSPTPCWERLTRLKAEGFIRGYHADIALARVAEFTKVVVTVSLKHHRKADFERFEAYVRAVDEITDCIATGGGVDYVMTVMVPGLAAFQTLMDALLEAEIGIDRWVIYIAARQVKSGRPNLARLTGREG